VTGKDNLPAKTKSQDVVTTTERGGGLVARGLAAIRSKKSLQPTDKTSPEELFADAVAAGKRKDWAEAIRLALLAANNGHVRSQEYLGSLYSMSDDRNRDYVSAYKWYQIASENLAGTDYWWMRDDVIKSRDWVGRMMPIHKRSKQIAEAQHLASQWSPRQGVD
jgi:TPR repeat protein